MNDVIETLNKLPPICWTVDLSNPNQVNAIKRGVAGYYPVRYHATAEKARASLVAQLDAATERERVLRRYGRHIDGCIRGNAQDYECTCGLDAALRQGD